MPASYPVTASASRSSHPYGAATERFNLFNDAALEVDEEEPPGCAEGMLPCDGEDAPRRSIELSVVCSR
jgi:hypothetical protein